MSPKEKAKELVEKFRYMLLPLFSYQTRLGERDMIQKSKQCALFAAGETWHGIDENFHAHPDKPHLSERLWNEKRLYWEEVKLEIEKIEKL